MPSKQIKATNLVWWCPDHHQISDDAESRFRIGSTIFCGRCVEEVLLGDRSTAHKVFMEEVEVHLESSGSNHNCKHCGNTWTGGTACPLCGEGIDS